MGQINRTIVNSPTFDFKLVDLNINFIGVSVSDQLKSTSVLDTVYVLNKNNKAVHFNGLALKDVVLRNRNLTSDVKNLIVTTSDITSVGDFVSLKYTYQYKGQPIGMLEIRYPWSYYTQENTLILPFQSFPIEAVYNVIDPGVLVNQYYGQSITEPNKKTGIIDANFVVTCSNKDGNILTEDITISVDVINGGFVRPASGGVVVTPPSGGGTQRTTAWRVQATSAYCVVNTLTPQPLYGKLTTANSHTTTTYYPNQTSYYQKSDTTTEDLVIGFYSDQACTVPVSLNNQTVRVIIKSVESGNQYSSATDPGSVVYTESTSDYLLTGISGASHVVSNVTSSQLVTQYPTMGSLTGSYTSQDVSYSYVLFDNNALVGGATGYKGWNTLEQYYTDDNTLTGLTMLNNSVDNQGNTNPYYSAPVQDNVNCPTSVPQTSINLGGQIRASAVSFSSTSGTKSVQFPSTPFSSGAGGVQFVVKQFPGENTTISINAASDSTGAVTHTGFLQISISYGNSQLAHFEMPVGTTATFGPYVNISNLNISNF